MDKEIKLSSLIMKKKKLFKLLYNIAEQEKASSQTHQRRPHSALGHGL